MRKEERREEKRKEGRREEKRKEGTAKRDGVNLTREDERKVNFSLSHPLKEKHD